MKAFASLSNRARVFGLIAVAASCAFLATAAPGKAMGHDSYCSVTNVQANTGFIRYALVEGAGVTSYRVWANISAYDRCNHGELFGYVAIYNAAIAQQGLSYRMYVSYKTTYQQSWTTALVSLVYNSSYGGWVYYNVETDRGGFGNIGLTNTGRITDVKLSVYLMSDGVPVVGTSGKLQCSFLSRRCGGYWGL